MKSGANRIQQNKIKVMAEAGTSVAEISYALQITESCIKSFFPDEYKDNSYEGDNPDMPIEPIAGEEVVEEDVDGEE